MVVRNDKNTAADIVGRDIRRWASILAAATNGGETAGPREPGDVGSPRGDLCPNQWQVTQ